MGGISGTARHQIDNIYEGIYNGAGLDGKHLACALLLV